MKLDVQSPLDWQAMVKLCVFSVILFVTSLQADDFSTEKCSSLRVRRNVNSLTREEINEYIDTLAKAYEQGVFDKMTDIHLADFQATHHQPLFLLYHRVFAWDFENRLRKINPKITIPYWVS